jgi:hypothetical protein
MLVGKAVHTALTWDMERERALSAAHATRSRSRTRDTGGWASGNLGADRSGAIASVRRHAGGPDSLSRRLA